MNVGEIEKKRVISELQEKIESLKKELDGVNLEECKKNVVKLEEKRNHLLLVKKTLLFMREKGLLIKSDISPDAEQISVRKMNQSDIFDTKDVRTLDKNPSRIILMILSGIIAVLFLCSWIDLNGYEINLFELAQQAERLTYMFGSSGGTSGIISFLWFVCIAQWVFALAYIYVIYELYKKGESSFFYGGIFGTIIIFLVFWIITLSTNSGIDDIYSGLSNYVSTELTWKAWVALGLAVASAAICIKQEEVNKQIFGIAVETKEENVRKIPVVNYYPWEEIRFTNAILNKAGQLSISLQYTVPSAWKSNGYIERWNSNIVVTADIILKVFRKSYVIYNTVFDVEWTYVKGTTEKMIIEHYSLNMNDIDEVRVIIKAIEMPGEKKREVHRVYAVSDMNSAELQRYRRQINCEDAVCREERFETGWRCSCGLIHDEAERRCMNCGSALSPKGDFIR